MIVFRLQNCLRTNPTRLLLITGALGQWSLNVLQDLDLSYIIYSHLPGKTLTLEVLTLKTLLKDFNLHLELSASPAGPGVYVCLVFQRVVLKQKKKEIRNLDFC